MLQAVILPKELTKTPASAESLWGIRSIECSDTKLQSCVVKIGQIQGIFMALHTGVYLYKIFRREYRIIRTLLLEENKL